MVDKSEQNIRVNAAGARNATTITGDATSIAGNDKLTNVIFKTGASAPPKATNLPYTRKTIIKLQSALLDLMAEHGEDYLPEERYVWYQAAGLSKSTFVDSISTYTNFLFFSWQELLADLAGCFNRFNITDFAKLIEIFLGLFVVDESGSIKAASHNHRRDSLIIATIKYPPTYWEDLFFFLVPCLKAEYPYTDDTAASCLLKAFGDASRQFLLAFVRQGAPALLLTPLRRILLHIKRGLFVDNYDFHYLVKDFGLA